MLSLSSCLLSTGTFQAGHSNHYRRSLTEQLQDKVDARFIYSTFDKVLSKLFYGVVSFSIGSRQRIDDQIQGRISSRKGARAYLDTVFLVIAASDSPASR